MQEDKKLLIRMREGHLHKVRVTCMDLNKFLDEIPKMGVSVLQEKEI